MLIAGWTGILKAGLHQCVYNGPCSVQPNYDFRLSKGRITGSNYVSDKGRMTDVEHHNIKHNIKAKVKFAEVMEII